MKADRSSRRQVEDWYEAAVNQARDGNHRIAEFLLRDFARLAADPRAFKNHGGLPTNLVQYVATCVGDWQKRGYSDAKTWFNVVRAPHGPEREIDWRHIRALRAYRLLLARKCGSTAAIEGAALSSHLSEGQVRALIQDQANPDKRDDALDFVVLEGINQRLHERVANPPRKIYRRSR